jgi:AraC-like DNA-binding protein
MREQPVYVIRDGGSGLEWTNVCDPGERVEPFRTFGQDAAREAHYRALLDEACRVGHAVCRSRFGFSDLIHPLADEPRAGLCVGPFYRVAPDWEGLSSQWQAITGQDATSANPELAHFVRMALSLPILGDDMLTTYQQLLAAYAVAIDPNNYTLTRRGHLPTTAMAIMPLDSQTAPLDGLQTLVRNAGIQRACIAFARRQPDIAATRLGDYGVSVITTMQTRLELRELAQKLQAFVRENFGVRSAVGIGTTQPPDAPLHESHREAVLALHMCAHLEHAVLFFDEHDGRAKLGYSALQHAMTSLASAFDREHATEIELETDRYAELVLRYAGERLEVARSHFLATLFQLWTSVLRRSSMPDEARDRFAADLTRALEEAPALYQVCDAFKEAIARLSLVASKTWQGSNVIRLEATLHYLRENFAEPLPLPVVARKAGFSVPTFSRVFRRMTGRSFLPYVRELRVEHAKKLIATTPMSIDEIAQSCGFQSQHHLIRSFKKATNQTPGAYRKARAGAEDATPTRQRVSSSAADW